MDYVWIDVWSKKLDIAFYGWWINVIDNNISSITNFFSVYKINNLIVIYEASGVYGRNIEFVCNKLGIQHFYLHPNIVSNLKKALWDQNKTDQIDAKYLASICPMLHQNNNNLWLKNKLIKWSSDEINSIGLLMTEFRRIKNFIIKLKQWLHCLEKNPYNDWDIYEFYQIQIKTYETRLKDIYKKVLSKIELIWLKWRYNNLMTIPWISEMTALELIVLFINLELKWLTKKDSKKVAKYVWINPKVFQSWTSVNSTWISKQWNKVVRKSLYMPWTCRKKLSEREKYKDTILARFYQRMEARFKPNVKIKRWKSVIMAIGKKLLVTARAMYCDNTAYKFI